MWNSFRVKARGGGLDGGKRRHCGLVSVRNGGSSPPSAKEAIKDNIWYNNN